MTYEYLFNPIAASEYENAYKWYRKKSEVAADNLIIEVEETIRAICKDPPGIEIAIKIFTKYLSKNILTI